jgi:hypothetical protein
MYLIIANASLLNLDCVCGMLLGLCSAVLRVCSSLLVFHQKWNLFAVIIFKSSCITHLVPFFYTSVAIGLNFIIFSQRQREISANFQCFAICRIAKSLFRGTLPTHLIRSKPHSGQQYEYFPFSAIRSMNISLIHEIFDKLSYQFFHYVSSS